MLLILVRRSLALTDECWHVNWQSIELHSNDTFLNRVYLPTGNGRESKGQAFPCGGNAREFDHWDENGHT